MGAWGAGTFESDGALDFMDGLLALADPRAAMKQAFGATVSADYLDSDIGGAALVSAAVIKAAMLGEPLLDRQSEKWTAWQARIARLDMSALKAPGAKACRRILADNSELRELWSENAKLFQIWKANVEAIAQTLER
jgi:hypothetical protein